MGLLGTPHRVIYEARAFASGLDNVFAYVMKPSGAKQGPIPLVEMTSPFTGRYYFDFLTALDETPGEFLCTIFSPSEGIQSDKVISLYPDNTAALAIIAANLQTIATSLESSASQITSATASLVESASNIEDATDQIISEINTLKQISSAVASSIVPAILFPKVNMTQYIRAQVKDAECVTTHSIRGRFYE